MADLDNLMSVRIKDDITLWLPDNVQDLATYVFLEQEDWFEPEVDFLRHYLKPGMKVVDIGGAFGAYSMPMAKAVGREGHVWSYEPSSRTSAILKKSAAENGFGWVEVITAAVSDKEGEASFSIYDNAEFNCLTVHVGEFDNLPTKAVETVQVVTLGDEAIARQFGKLDFIKIDAEGEELKILESCKDFLFSDEAGAPLIMVEVNADGRPNQTLIDQLRGMGFGIYQLLSGPNMLVPMDQMIDDPALLNAFCCLPTRAAALEKEGLLCQNLPLPPMADGQWDAYLAKADWLALHQSVTKNFQHFLSGPNDHQYLESLNYFAAYANDGNGLSMPEKLAALKRSGEILIDLNGREKTLCRRLTAGRVFLELGLRLRAGAILQQAAEQITGKGDPIVIEEPFVFPYQDYEKMAPNPADIPPEQQSTQLLWIAGAMVIEGWARSGHFSSYYTGKEILPCLRLLQTLPYKSAAMERQLQLRQLRQGEITTFQPSELFDGKHGRNLNPEIWKPA